MNMLYDFTDTQNVADMLKPYIERQATSAERAAGIETLQRFESSGWIPRAFEDAAQTAPGEFLFDPNGRLIYRAADNAAAEITAVLADYLVRTNAVSAAELYTVKEAASYLDVSPETIKSAVSRYKNLRIEKRAGRTMLFSRQELDRWRTEEHHKPGPRPAANPE